MYWSAYWWASLRRLLEFPSASAFRSAWECWLGFGWESGPRLTSRSAPPFLWAWRWRRYHRRRSVWGLPGRGPWASPSEPGRETPRRHPAPSRSTPAQAAAQRARVLAPAPRRVPVWAPAVLLQCDSLECASHPARSSGTRLMVRRAQLSLSTRTTARPDSFARALLPNKAGRQLHVAGGGLRANNKATRAPAPPGGLSIRLLVGRKPPESGSYVLQLWQAVKRRDRPEGD